MRLPDVSAVFSRLYRLYLYVVLLILLPLFIFGSLFFGGFGQALESARSGVLYFEPFAWATFVLPPLLLPAFYFSSRNIPDEKTRTTCVLGLVSVLLLATILLARYEDPPWAGDYLRGAYRLEDGRVLVINSSPVAALDFWLSDGTRAMTWTGDQRSFSGITCIGSGVSANDFIMESSSPQARRIDVKIRNEQWHQARRLNLRETPVSFASQGTALRGLLVEPMFSGPVPLLVFPEGETTVSSLENEHEHHLLAGLGFATFIYDARGVGESGGRRSDNDDVLIADALAAVEAAKTHAGRRASRVGLYGSSFAAKVAAAADVDFSVIVAPLALESEIIDRTGARQLYMLPGADEEAPARPLVNKLHMYQRAGRSIDIALYPATQFSIIRSERRNGSSCQAGKAKSYYDVIAEWVRTGALAPRRDMIALPAEA